MNLYQKINEVMKKVSYVQKGEKKVNNMYRFAAHDTVVGLLHPIMAEVGIVCVPVITSHCLKTNKNQLLTEVEITSTFINSDKPEERFDVVTWGYGLDSQDKGIGKAITYATKYAFLKVFMLETGDDPENDYVDCNEGLLPTKVLENADVIIQSNHLSARLKKIFSSLSSKGQSFMKESLRPDTTNEEKEKILAQAELYLNEGE